MDNIKPIEQTQSYLISRFETQGDSMFICLNSTNNPVYLEHFFSADEQADIEGTIEGLVAQLQILDDNYVAPLPVISKLDEVKSLTINTDNIASKKSAILVERQAVIDAQKIQPDPIDPIEKLQDNIK